MLAFHRYGALIGGMLLFSTAAGAQALGLAGSGPDHLTDAQGTAVYVLDGAAACTADCALLWPPVPADQFRAAAASADARLVGAVVLPDGTAEATYAGKPLHYFAEDAQPGDVNGHRFQEFGTVGYLVSHSGREVGGRTATVSYADDEACGCTGVATTIAARFATAFDAPDRPAAPGLLLR